MKTSGSRKSKAASPAAAALVLACVLAAGGCNPFGGGKSKGRGAKPDRTARTLARRYNEAGIEETRRGNHRGALHYFAKAVETDSTVSVYYSNLGRSLYQVGRFDDALKAYARAMELGPASNRERAVLKANIGDVYRQRKQYDEAERCYHEALAENPGMARVHYELGNLHLKRREMSKALYRLNQAVKLDPAYDRAILARAILYHLTYHDDLAWQDVLRLERMGLTVQQDLKREILRGIEEARNRRRFQPAH